MPYWVKQYYARKLNLISSRSLPHGGGGESTLRLELSWKQSESSPISFAAVSADNQLQQSSERYVVTLVDDGSNKKHNATTGPYKLYSSKHKNKAEEAMLDVHKILSPLSPHVSITQDLLMFIILPAPKTLEDLPYSIAHYTLKLPSAYSKEWRSLAGLRINSFPIAYCMCEVTNMAVLKELSEAGVDLSVSHPVTGSTILHLAIQVSDECLREALDCLEGSLTSSIEYREYIDRKCDCKSVVTTVGTVGSSGGGLVRRGSTLRRASRSFTSEDSFLSVDKILRRSNSPLDPFPFKLGAVTPLMLATRKNCVRSVHYLLVVGADPNCQDPVRGMTALHIAAVLCNVSIVKLLLCFEADLQVTDSNGKTPLDTAREQEAQECLEVMETIQALREKRNTSPPQSNSDDETQSASKGETTITLLSLDGGGTRGTIASFTLYYLEQRMRSISCEPLLQIRHYFDWFTGTSIGAIFTLGMVHNDRDTFQVMSSVVNNRFQALAGKRIYDGPTQDFIARKVMGEKEVTSLMHPRVLVTTARADQDPPRLVHITNYRQDPGDGRNWKAWEAGRASAAAPMFFPSFEQKYVDGGLLAVNPTQHALHDIHVYDGRKVGLVLSLGTGKFESSANESIDLVRPRLTHLLSDLQQDLKFLKSLKCMLTANIVNSEDTVLHSKCWCESQGGVYHRLSPTLTQRYELDEKSDEGFVLFFYETYLYLMEIDGQINDIAVRLLEHGPIHVTETETAIPPPSFKSTWV